MDENKDFYKKRIENYNKQIEELTKKSNIFSFLRILIVVFLCVMLYLSYKNNNNILAVTSTLGSVVLFIVIAVYHSGVINEIKKKNCYIKLNEKSESRLNGEWKKFEDTGSEFLNVDHPFSNDLDVFGKNSLFQLINSTTTKFGRDKLSSILKMDKLPDKEEILKRQSIVKELGKKIDFRQDIEVEGSFNEKGKGDPSDFINWAKGKNDNILKPYMRIISFLCPIALIVSTVVYFSTHAISKVIPISLVMLNIIAVKLGSKDMAEALDVVYEVKYNIKKYFNIIKIIDKEEFKNKETLKLKESLNKDGVKSSDSMKELADICTKVNDRNNMVYFLINIIFLWDYHLLYKLELWRRKNGKHLEEWFDVIGNFEAYNSIANISSEFKDYSYPNIEDNLTISAEDIAHPLIGERAVSNSFSLEKSKSIILITGSNMSGKSTFLRTIGINMILSYIGAPVRAKKFNTPILHIYTCMRIGDNLEENVSSFYAEILRVKLLMNAVKKGEKVFFLLDELFKGTNSMDRHTGAEILVKQLSAKPCLGLLSTHDLELCDLEETNSRVLNYHFEEHYVNNEIKFDYRLRRGKSTTRNAIYLMRMAGIDV